MTWEQTNPGHNPPVTWPVGPKIGTTITFEEWIQCQDYFTVQSNSKLSELCSDPRVKNESMFSPRRGHGAVVAHNVLYVIGGRAQEFVAASNIELIGGVIDRNIQTIRDHWSVREDVLLKNDVWLSEDGLGHRWTLLSPGCNDPQLDVFLHTEVTTKHNKHLVAGSLGAKCVENSDCYGEALCHLLEGTTDKVCICPMFGPREHHSVSVQHRYFKYKDGKSFSEDYIYIVGGFTSVRNSFCSYHSCGSSTSYRLALEDAWVSNNGRNWIQMKPAISKPSNTKYQGRGAHASLLIHSNPFANDQIADKLWIFGGETSDPANSTSLHLNDVWSVNLKSQPCCYEEETCHERYHPLKDQHIGVCLPTENEWTEVFRSSPWIGRSGHVAIHEPPSSQNQFRDLIYIIGGGNDDNALNDTWVWELGNERNWTQDFYDDRQIYRIGNRGVLFRANAPEQSPYHSYFSSLSPIGNLFRQYLPIATKRGDVQSWQPITKSLLSDEYIQLLEKLGLRTILDLSQADIYTILKLRGVDPPKSKNYTVPNICYLRELSRSLVAKCTVGSDPSEDNNAEIPLISSLCLQQSDSDDAYMDSQCVAEHWDGCEPINGYSVINVYKVGEVPVPQHHEDASKDLQDLFCQTIPQPRISLTGAFYHGKVVIAGGKGHKDSPMYQDVWYRDDTFPQSSIRTRPKTNSTGTTFAFDTNKAGSFLIEFKVFDTVERLDVTPWIATTVTAGADLSWLDRNKGGPGNGWYTMYIRAVDSCGNRDMNYSQLTNMYNWFYMSPRPWGKIIGLTFLLICLLGYCYIEIRRRLRKKALERILMRQMKQKYKFHPGRDHEISSDKYAITKNSTSKQRSPIEKSNLGRGETSRRPHKVTSGKYRRDDEDTSSSPDIHQAYKHSRAPFNSASNSRNASYWDDDYDSFDDSDESTRLRRRREIEHQGKLYTKGGRRTRIRAHGKITPKKSA